MANQIVNDVLSSACLHENPVYDLARGEVVCGGCGLILDQQITDSEALSFSRRGRQKPSRRGEIKR